MAKSRKVNYPHLVGVNLSDEMCQRLKDMAEKEGRTVSQQIRWLINKIFEKEGKKDER